MPKVHVKSKAAWRSKKIASTDCPWFFAERISCCSLASWSRVERPFLKPDWKGFSMFLDSNKCSNLFLTIISNNLPACDVKLIGRYEFGSFLSLPGLGIGITVACFHSGGTLPVLYTWLNKFSQIFRVMVGIFLNIKYAILSGPVAVLLLVLMALNNSVIVNGKLRGVLLSPGSFKIFWCSVSNRFW